ncbi:MAG: insulinase family protein, partial [Gemmatimonadetes bacterium]|nr:insulinase family protein [Gemmatimonadota bacterium]
MIRFLVILALTLWSGLASAQSVRAPRLHVLDNGLRLLTVEDRATPIVTVTWSAHVGDSAEPPDFAGNSHYLEHLLLFRGTEKFPKNEIGEWVASRGGYFNGHTWYDYTTFEIMSAPGDLDASLERHEQMMFHAAFSGEDFETEKKAVFEELRGGLDNPYGYIWRAAPYKMYPKETYYSRSTIGTIETVQAATVDRVRRYYKDYYVPNNMTMAVVGDIDTEDVIAKVSARFGRYERSEVPANRYEPVSMKKGVNVVAEERDVGKAYMLLALEGPRAEAPEFYPYVLLAGYLSNGKTSLFQDELISKRKLVGNISMAGYPRRFAKGWQAIDLECEPAAAVKSVGAIWELVARVQTEGISQADLELARKRLISDHRFSLDDQYQVASRLVESDAHGDYRLFSEYEERLGAVTAADVQAVAMKYFDPAQFFLMAIFPPDEIPANFESEVKVAARNNVPPAGGIVSRTLPSGATLLHEARPGSATESFTLAVMAGDRDETVPGTAGAVTRMMTERTKSMTKQELQDLLDRNGFQLSAWNGRDASYFNLAAPAGATEEAAALLLSIVTTPSFAEAEWAPLRVKIRSDVESAMDQPTTIAVDNLYSTAFAGTGYGSTLREVRSGIESLQPGDLEAFWKKRYRAGSIAVAYSGGASENTVANSLRGLAALDGKAPARKVVRSAPRAGEVRVAAPMEGKTQANLNLAWPSPPTATDEAILWKLAERAIGGDLAGRLWKLRQDEGLAYTVWI